MSQPTVEYRDLLILEVKDKNGDVILPGMTIVHDEGDEEDVYLCSDEKTLGLNASNEGNAFFDEFNRQLYPIHQFDMSEWQIKK